MRRTSYLPILRLPILLLLAVLASGCAHHNVRGELVYDLRPKAQREEIVFPKPPDTARYRYAGELIGEFNFQRNNTHQSTLTNVFNFVVGLVEEKTPMLLQRPQHGMVGDKGRIYIADPGRGAVVVFDPNPPSDGKSNDDGGQMLVWDHIDDRIRLGSPVAVAQIWDGDIAVSDAKFGVVFRLNTQGQFVAAIGEGQLQRPTGIAFDSKRGLLFVADTAANDVKIFDAAGTRVHTISHAGDEPLNAPTLMSFADDKLYVTDTLNSRVQVFDHAGTYLRSIGERGLYVGNFSRPKGVAVDNNGLIYVVESYYGHLLVFDQAAQFLMGIDGTGMKDGSFHLPSGVWSDNKGKIFIADMFNGRVVIYEFLGSSEE